MSFIICKGQLPPTIALDIPNTMRTAIPVPIPSQSEWLLIPTTNPAITDDKIGIHTKRASRPRICAARNKTRSPPIISNIIILAELLFSRMCPILSSILTNNSQIDRNLCIGKYLSDGHYLPYPNTYPDLRWINLGNRYLQCYSCCNVRIVVR